MDKAKAKKQFKRARRLYQEQRYEEALALLDELENEFPGNTNLLFPLARCYAKVGRTEEARRICVRLSAEFDHEPARKLLGKLEPAVAARELPEFDSDFEGDREEFGDAEDMFRAITYEPPPRVPVHHTSPTTIAFFAVLGVTVLAVGIHGYLRYFRPPPSTSEAPPRAAAPSLPHLEDGMAAWVETAQNAQRGKVRQMNFPETESLGNLYVRPVGSPYEGDWEKFGEARGRIVVPAGNEVKLEVTPLAKADLAPLAKLDSDALDALSLARVNLRDEELRHIANLTGLQHLNISQTRLSNTGLAFLGTLFGLRTLDLNRTHINDTGLVYLNTLHSLRKLDLSTTDCTVAGVERLQGSLANCEIVAKKLRQ